MPVLLDGVTADSPAFPWIGLHPGVRAGGRTAGEDGGLHIGLVNNMPDAALQATERQFVRLLAASAPQQTLRLHLFSLPGLPRGAHAAAHISASYAPFASLGAQRLDALIVTGCEPKAAALPDEPYWAGLTRLVDWAAQNTISTLWSCLAAHAAVLHLDGVQRQRLPVKRSGLFDCTTTTAAHPLLAGAPSTLHVPHSRWNDLAATDLRDAGYQILTASPEAGVDLFVKPAGSLFVFFQGHPEYDADSIAREYRRDVARYLRAERPDYPGLPHAYFSATTEAALRALEVLARADRTAVPLRDLPRQLDLRPGLAENWQTSVAPVFRNWLDLLAEARGGRADARSRQAAIHAASS